MISTLSTQAGRRYPQMGSTGLPWAGRLVSIGGIDVPVIPPSTIDHQAGGGGEKKRTRRKRTYELFAEMERTIWTELTGPVVVEAPARTVAPVAPVVALEKGYDHALDQLLATAGEYEELSRRVQTLRANITAYQRDRQRAIDEDDEDVWLLM